MNNSKFHLETLTERDIRDNDGYDLLIAALGFESRATAISGLVVNRSRSRIALGFDHNHALSYIKNEAWFNANAFKIIPNITAEKFGGAVKREIEISLDSSLVGCDQSKPIRVAVDISCFDRRRLAEIVSEIQKISASYKFAIDFLYCVAQFDPPTPSVGRNEVAGPIHRKFAGRFTDPGYPLVMIVGLGYEIGKVMGAVEFLQATRVIAFSPESPISDYEPEVQRANELLLGELDPSDIITYPVSDPKRTLAILDSVVRGLKDTHNIVLLPGGPKIFALSCLLTQILHPQTSVWRISSGSSIKAKDVFPSDVFLGLRWQNDSHVADLRYSEFL